MFSFPVLPPPPQNILFCFTYIPPRAIIQSFIRAPPSTKPLKQDPPPSYSAYEGLKPKEIRQLREEKGLNTASDPWDIWRDGCEDGESPAQVTARIDSLIARIKEIQGPNMHGENPSDIVLVAHGHLTRAFAKRWLGYPLDFPLSLMMEPGGVGVLSYQHHSVDEPALLLGIGFPTQ